MLAKINEFFSIESKDYKKINKGQLQQKRRMEEYRSEII